MEVTYHNDIESIGVLLAEEHDFVALITGLLPSEPVFVIRARDAAFSAVFAAWWAETMGQLSDERQQAAKASAQTLMDGAERHPQDVRLAD